MKTESKATKVKFEPLAYGALWQLTLDAPKGNVLDAAMTRELTARFEDAADTPELKAIVLTAAGKHFSFGASVEEHLPGSVAGMLAGFHGLLRSIARCRVPVIVGVRGLCLGGGLELASFCHRVFAQPGAQFGQPEIALGVFAPAASAILPARVGRGAADDLLLTGRTIGASEALRIGLVDAVADDPEAAAVAWAEEHFLPRSAASIRFATGAARLNFDRQFEADITTLERLYLDELMSTRDALEGLESFLEKRPPQWSNA